MEAIKNIDLLNMVSEVELIYRVKIKPSQRPHIRRSQDSYDIFNSHWDLNKIDFVEQFKVLYLNRGNRALALIELSTGGVSGTVADPKLIFTTALKLNASALILCHNHPSGSLTPSSYDLSITEKIKNAGRFLDILVADHIILSSEGYFSFGDEGLL
jgi:DNA repair protein RadC